MKAELATVPNARPEIDALNAQAWALRDLDTSRGLALAQTAYRLAETAQYDKGIADSLINACQFNFSDIRLLLENVDRALPVYETLGDRAGQCRALYTLCCAYWWQDNFALAVETGLGAQKLAQEIGDRALEADVLNNLALAYKRSGNYVMAFAAYAEALDFYRASGDVMRQVKVLTNMALACVAQGTFERALTFAHAALRFDLPNPHINGYTLLALGQSYAGLKQLDRALSYLEQTLSIADTRAYHQLALAALFSMGEICIEQQNPARAVVHLERALKVAHTIQSNLYLFRCHETLSRVYENQGDLARALAHYKEFHTVKELVFNESNTSRLQFLETHHRTEIARREAEIYHLRNVELEQEISERKRIEAALRESKEQLHDVIASNADGIIVVDSAGLVQLSNPAAAELLKRPFDEFVGQPFNLPTDLTDSVEIDLSQPGQQVRTLDIRIRKFQWRNSPAFLVSLRDTTERKRLKDILQQQATTDELTGLANRRHFIRVADLELKRAQRFHHELALALMDIDHFKKVNDTHGHAAGDRVLNKFAEICQRCTRETDSLGRLGGDEFVLLLPETNCRQAYQVVERVRAMVAAQSFDMDGYLIPLTVSAGIACLTGNEISLDALLERADRALYESKTTGRNHITLAEPLSI